MPRIIDIVVGCDYPKIEVRTYDSYGEDILMGYCSYIDEQLISLDGDDYYEGEVVCGFEVSNSGDNTPSLTIWIPGIWVENETEITIENKYEAQMLTKYLESGRDESVEARVKYLEGLR